MAVGCAWACVLRERAFVREGAAEEREAQMCSHCGLTVCLLWLDNKVEDGGATKLAEALATDCTVTSINLACE